MNQTIKEETVKRYHDDDHDQLRRHQGRFVDACHPGRRVKTLKGLTPYAFICKCWTSEPKRVEINLLQKMPGFDTIGGVDRRGDKDPRSTLFVDHRVDFAVAPALNRINLKFGADQQSHTIEDSTCR